MEFLAVEHNGQARIQKDVILQKAFYEFVLVLIFFEDFLVRNEIDKCSVCFVSRLDSRLLCNDGFAVFDPFTLSFAEAGNQEITAQGIHSLDTDTVQSDRLFKCLAVVLGTCVHFTGYVDHLSQRNATAIVPDGNSSFFDGHFYSFAIPHHVFVDGVIEYFFQQYIDPIIRIATISQFTNIHTRAPADMFHPVQRLDIVVIIRCRLLHC